MKRIEKLIKITILSIALVTGLAACSGTESSSAKETDIKETLKEINIGYPSSGSNWAGGALGIANEYGYLEEYLNPIGYTANLNSFVGAAPAIHEALVSEDLDYVVYAGFASLLGKSNGIDIQLLAVTSFSSGWRLVASADSGINSIADLKGKKVAYARGASPHMYLIKVLQEGGLSFNDVEAVNMTIPDGLSTLASGGIDAAIVSGGQEDSLVKEGKAVVLHIGFDADKNTYYEPSVLIGRRKVIEENPEVAVAITKALLKAKDKIKEDRDAFYQLSAEKSGNPLNIILATAEEDADIAFPLNLNQVYIDSLKQVQDFLIRNELIANEIDFEKWINTSIIQQASEEYKDGK